jgi:DNA polymerase-4
VVPYHETPAAKSLGHEYTLPRDEREPSVLRRYLLGICEEVGADLRTEGKVGETIHLKIRMRDYKMISRQSRAAEPTSSTRRIFRIAWTLLCRIALDQPIRLIGVSVSGLCPEPEVVSSDLFEDPKTDALDRTADAIRERFGSGMIRRAALLPERQP